MIHAYTCSKMYISNHCAEYSQSIIHIIYLRQVPPPKYQYNFQRDKRNVHVVCFDLKRYTYNNKPVFNHTYPIKNTMF